MNECHFCKLDGGRDPKIGLKCGVCFHCALDRGPSVFESCINGTFDFAKFVSEGGKQSGTMIQTLILSKEKFKTADAAADWVVTHGFGAEKVDTSGESFRFRQRDPGDFKEDGFGEGEQFRTIILSDGVSAVIGFLEDDKAQHTHKPHADGGCMTGFRRQGDLCVRIGSSADNSKAEDRVEKRRSSPFVKIDPAKRLVSGAVLVPDVRDLGGDFEFTEDIEKAAHGFMLNRRRKIGEMHQIFDGIGDPVESHLLRVDTTFKGGKVLPAGTWIMTVKVTNNSTWNKVENGEITGFSIGYRGLRTEVKGTIAVVGAKAKQSGIKALGIFHLHDIDVHEVSLVDRAMIEEVFTEVKEGKPEGRKAAAEMWMKSVVRDRLKAGEISEDVKTKAGIMSEREPSDGELLEIAKAIGLEGVDPKGDEKMTKEEMKKFIEGLLAPVVKSVGVLEKYVAGQITAAEKKAEDEKKAKAEKDKKDAPVISEEVKNALAPIMEKLSAIEKSQEQIVKDTIGRFEDLEKHVGAKSEKISGQDEEGNGKKKAKWPSFSGVKARGG